MSVFIFADFVLIFQPQQTESIFIRNVHFSFYLN